MKLDPRSPWLVDKEQREQRVLARMVEPAQPAEGPLIAKAAIACMLLVALLLYAIVTAS